MTLIKAQMLVYRNTGSNIAKGEAGGEGGEELTREMKAQIPAMTILTARPPTAMQKVQILHV
jgi:hypothetical protein